MLRRTFDITFALVGLVLWAMPFIVIAVLIKATSPGPVFYLQQRVGRGGRLFRLYKFRTMRCTAGGPQISPEGDARITRVGHYLRRWKIDELPQLWNVLRGDMSVIGPRPEVERYVRHYSPAERAILDAKPGLAGMAALLYADEPQLLAAQPDPEDFYIRELMPRKLAADLSYERGRSFRSDLKLMARLGLSVLGKKGQADQLAPVEPKHASLPSS